MSNKLGIVGTWFRICASGFGMGVDAAKAVGIVVFILSLVFVVGIAILWWIIKFFINRNKAKKEEAAATAAATTAATTAAKPEVKPEVKPTEKQ
ncbi:MAG: hypothetical protein J6A66_06115 [Alistipes sp.]|nr:hypothetical protein [Alistipes sp.]